MLGVVAQITVKSGCEAAFEEAAGRLVEQSRREPGCLEYGLWRTEQPLHYAFVERYVDAAAVEAHRRSDHFRGIGRELGAFMEGPPALIRLTSI